ncbi:uncharacterized protein LOC125377463 [Haliotis rufescens]|uniref:uncharacterized protein LOC125377463 n=1 Tax=Haliotis rufescens TaxID=6454 RepID=UPI00201EBF3B|nr:uncharacterized protein LOC125377463 [Haliotis rufescens]
MIWRVKCWMFLGHKMTLLSLLIATWIHVRLACNPDFCISRAHGEYFCDTADSASYYRCDNGITWHFTCGLGTVYDGSICNLPPTACITNPVPDPSSGEVVNGICVATAGSSTGTTGSTGSMVSPETTGTAAPPNCGYGILWHLYRRYLNMKSACAVLKEFPVATPISCASKCTMSGTCTGFNLYTQPNNLTRTLRYVCQLVACPGDHLLSFATEDAFYDQI